MAVVVPERTVDAVDGLCGRLDRHLVLLMGDDAPSRQMGHLLQRLPAALVARGDADLAVGWLLADDQDVLDRLVTGQAFDDAAAVWVTQRWAVRRGGLFAEYLDVIRAVWAANRRRPAGVRPVRLIGLDAELDLHAVTETADLTHPVAWRHLRPAGTFAPLAAAALRTQVLDAGRRVVAVVPDAHARTRLRTPAPDGEPLDLEVRDGLVYGVGNRLFSALGDRVATVRTHRPRHPDRSGDEVAELADVLSAARTLDRPRLVEGRDETWLVLAADGEVVAPTPMHGMVTDANIVHLRRGALDPRLRRPTSTPADFDARLTDLVRSLADAWRPEPAARR